MFADAGVEAAAGARHDHAREGRPRRSSRDRSANRPKRDHRGAHATALAHGDRLPPPRIRGPGPAPRRRRADRRRARGRPVRQAIGSLRRVKERRAARRGTRRIDREDRRGNAEARAWCRSCSASLLLASERAGRDPECPLGCDLHRRRGWRARMRQHRAPAAPLRAGTAPRSTSTSPSRRSQPGTDGNYPLIIVGHGYGGSKIGFGTSARHRHARVHQPRLRRLLDDRPRLPSSPAARRDHAPAAGLRQRLHPPDGRSLRGPRRAVLRRRARRRRAWSTARRSARSAASYGGGLSLPSPRSRTATMLPDGSLVPWTSPVDQHPDADRGGEPRTSRGATSPTRSRRTAARSTTSPTRPTPAGPGSRRSPSRTVST